MRHCRDPRRLLRGHLRRRLWRSAYRPSRSHLCPPSPFRLLRRAPSRAPRRALPLAPRRVPSRALDELSARAAPSRALWQALRDAPLTSHPSSPPPSSHPSSLSPHLLPPPHPIFFLPPSFIPLLLILGSCLALLNTSRHPVLLRLFRIGLLSTLPASLVSFLGSSPLPSTLVFLPEPPSALL